MSFDKKWEEVFDLSTDWYDIPSEEMTLEQARAAVRDLRRKLSGTVFNDDVISREEVIKTINYYWMPEDASETILVDMINELPPVQPARPKGHWIELMMHRGMENYKCSVCNQESYVPVCMEEPLYSFCPVCGAKMENGA